MNNYLEKCVGDNFGRHARKRTREREVDSFRRGKYSMRAGAVFYRRLFPRLNNNNNKNNNSVRTVLCVLETQLRHLEYRNETRVARVMKLWRAQYNAGRAKGRLLVDAYADGQVKWRSIDRSAVEGRPKTNDKSQ